MIAQSSFWHDKPCLVTGVYGFIGTHLCESLSRRGAKIVGLDRLPSEEGTFFATSSTCHTTPILHADVRRSDELATLADYSFDVVFHLAAQPISPLSNQRPAETMETNVTGTANVGNVLGRQKTPPIFVFASSACWYGASTSSPLKEDDPYAEGEYKYSESKVRAEAEVVKFEDRYGMPTARCRFVNLFGPGDRHFSRLVPKTLRHLIRGEHPSLRRDDGSTVLDFMHVADAVNALIACAEHGRSVRGEVFNFGVGAENARSARDVATLVSRAFDGKERVPVLHNARVPRTRMKFLDPSKAARRLGWMAGRKLEEGLAETARWYKDHIDEIEHLAY